MEQNAIGLIELSSIAGGYEVADLMLKTADVELILARTICSGKYMALIGGDVAAVTASIKAGSDIQPGAVIDSMVIPRVHRSLFGALAGTNEIPELESLGIIESFSVASLLVAADAAVKSASVTLLEIRLAMALGGKAFATLTGEVAAVRSAVEVGADLLAKQGLLVNKVVIPAPRPELLRDYV
jgi:microcompartment protein CcmL/EutN